MSARRSPSLVISTGEPRGFACALGLDGRRESQFYDLVEIFRIGGHAPHTNYLFLGESRESPARASRADTTQATMSTAACSPLRRSRCWSA